MKPTSTKRSPKMTTLGAKIARHATKITRNEQMRVIFAVYYILGELWKTASYPQDTISNESLWIL